MFRGIDTYFNFKNCPKKRFYPEKWLLTVRREHDYAFGLHFLRDFFADLLQFGIDRMVFFVHYVRLYTLLIIHCKVIMV